MEDIMSMETVYRFFVRQKVSTDEEASRSSRRIFLARGYLSDSQATQRYEVVERLEHTVRRRESADSALARGMH